MKDWVKKIYELKEKDDRLSVRGLAHEYGCSIPWVYKMRKVMKAVLADKSLEELDSINQVMCVLNMRDQFARRIAEIKMIDHRRQRYETCGDWYPDKTDGALLIKVSRMKDIRYSYLLAAHELVEAILCINNGITAEIVDKWDLEHIESKDPGSIPGCPYFNQHRVATIVEKLLASQLNVDWDRYEKELESL